MNGECGGDSSAARAGEKVLKVRAELKAVVQLASTSGDGKS